jgi:hypothetical protein
MARVGRKAPPCCAWYCLLSLVLAIVFAGLYQRDFAGGKKKPDAHTYRNNSEPLSMTDDVSHAGRRLRASFTTTTAPIDPDGIRVDDDETDRVCFPIVRHQGLRPERFGQIVDGTSFAAALTALAQMREVRRVLELGTWYGGGSTQNLARGIDRTVSADNCVTRGMERCCRDLVITVEVFEPAWAYARRYLHDLPVWCVRGSIVTPEEMLSAEDVPPRNAASTSNSTTSATLN